MDQSTWVRKGQEVPGSSQVRNTQFLRDFQVTPVATDRIKIEGGLGRSIVSITTVPDCFCCPPPHQQDKACYLGTRAEARAEQDAEPCRWEPGSPVPAPDLSVSARYGEYWVPWEQELRENVKAGVCTLLGGCALRSPGKVERDFQRRGKQINGVIGTKSDPRTALSSISFRPLCTEHWGTRGESLPTFRTTFLHQPL